MFADRGLQIELLEPAPGPENVRRVAQGDADFCLTSVNHYLTARAQTGDLAARFVAVVVQRSPIAAIVADDAEIQSRSDLAGRRIAGPPDGRLVAEYEAALVTQGIGASVLVPTAYAEAPAALARGEADAVPDFADLVPRVRRQAGIAVRAVPVGLDVYASGLVAGDRVPAELVERMRESIVAALELQRDDPKAGLSELVHRYPGVDPADALEGWALVEPNIFTGARPGSMNPSRWQETLTYACTTHRLPLPAPETVYRQ